MARRKTTPAVPPKKPLSQRLFPNRKKSPRRPEEKLTYLLKETPLVKVAAAVLLYQGGKILLDDFNDESDNPTEDTLTTIIPKSVPIGIGNYFNHRVGEWVELTAWDFEDNLTFVSKGTTTPINTTGFPQSDPSLMLRLMSPNKIAEYLHSVFTGTIYPDDATNQEHCLLMNILYSMTYKYNNAQLRAIFNAFLIAYGENLAEFIRLETVYLFSDWAITPYERALQNVRSRLGTAGALKKQGGKSKSKNNLVLPIAAVAAGVYFVRN